LISKNTVIGVLHLNSLTPHIYSANELRVAELVGDQIAGAIANSQLFAEHVRSSEALRESEERYRDLVENAVSGFYQVDKKGKFLLVNQKMAEMFGYESTQEFMANDDNITNLYVYPEIRPKILKEMNEKGFVQGREIEFRTRDGEYLWVKINTRIKTDKAGVVIYEGLMEDITERKQLETQLQHAQRMESIGTLAGGIAHDFNNLLMAIQGNTSLILLHIDITHPHYDKMIRIEKLVKNGAKLTGQLLGYARKGKYEAKPINFNQVVEETIDTFARARKEIQIHKALAEDLSAIEADKGQIEQVLLNLFLNAADAMDNRGDLFIATVDTTATDMNNKRYDPKPGSYVSLRVSDTGAGMDKKTIERIFEPFFTTKKMGRGTGLGLASTYGIIKAHGGYIDVESEKHRGTTFFIYLPALGIKAERKIEIPEKIIRGNETVLFVDDEETVLEVGSKMLKHLGYSVHGARGGQEALDIYENNKNRIDMVVLDMIMPGIGGSDTYDRLKEINPTVKVLLSSGYSLDGQAEDILRRGCDGFLQKPFDMIELSRKLKEVLK
jgi:two-component system, cell cycle sensor histidine kinase and response regulator CckA